MATASISTRSIQGESLSAAIDRLVNTALLREGVIDFDGDSYKVAQDTGSNMQVKIGSGTANDRAVVEGDNAGQGTFICEHENATQTLSVAAADATDDRIDIVVLRVYDDTFDSSGLDEADLEVIQGTPAGSPSAPATPDSALKLAEIEVGAGVTAITDADITDSRYEAPVRGQHVETLYITSSTTFDKADYPWLDKVIAKVQAGGGGGGNAVATGGAAVSFGEGGGGGAYAEAEVAVGDLSASETVTVGSGGGGSTAGGDSSFGTHAVAGGGPAGFEVTESGVMGGIDGAPGGVATAGDLQISGGPGGPAWGDDDTFNRAQAFGGGNSHLGRGGRGTNLSDSSGNGGDGQLYGGGGGGSHNRRNQSGASGGSGADGIVILELYA